MAKILFKTNYNSSILWKLYKLKLQQFNIIIIIINKNVMNIWIMKIIIIKCFLYICIQTKNIYVLIRVKNK